MKTALKTYEGCLKAIGPVFVGSGKEISKKEYMFLQNGNVAVFDIEKLYALLGQKHLQREYEKFLYTGGPRDDLRGWLRNWQIPVREVSGCIKYQLAKQDSIQEKNPRLQIMECIKDPYGNPYIPGSSVKGMLRTILLCEDIRQHPQKYETEKEKIKRELFSAPERQGGRGAGRKQVLARTIREIEMRCFHLLERNSRRPEDAVNDMLSGLIVSDSRPLKVSDLALCQKIEKHTDGSETALPLLRECLRPGMEILFSLTVDESVCEVSVKRIQNAIAGFAEIYEESFWKSFADVDRLRENSVFLGGGSGFVSKTMIYAMFPGKEGVRIAQKIFEKTGVPENHGHRNDLKYGVSPHIWKGTHFEGKTLPMGLCRMELR